MMRLPLALSLVLFLATPRAPTTSAPEVLVSSVTVMGIAADGDDLYYVDGNSLLRLTGGKTATVATWQKQGMVYLQAVRDGNAFFTSAGEGSGTGGVLRVDRDGELTRLAWDEPFSNQLALSEEYVFWSSLRGILRTSPSGGRPTLIAADPKNAIHLATDAKWVYWGEWNNDGAILRAPIGGGEAEVLARNQPRPQSLEVSNGALYWTNYGVLDDESDPEDGGGAVMKLSLLGGTPQALVKGVRPYHLAVVGEHVYWTDRVDKGVVARVPVTGGKPQVIAAGERYPTFITVLGSWVYWSTGSELRRAPRDSMAR